MKKRHSLITFLLGMQAVIFAGILAFVLFGSFQVYQKARRDSLREKEAMLRSAADDMQSRTDVLRQRLLELYLDVNMENRIDSGDYAERYFGLNACKELLEEACGLYGEIAYGFISRPGDFHLDVAENGMALQEKTALRDEVNRYAQEFSAPPGETEWKIRNVEGSEWFVLAFYDPYGDTCTGIWVRTQELLSPITDFLTEAGGVYEAADADGNRIGTLPERMKKGRLAADYDGLLEETGIRLQVSFLMDSYDALLDSTLRTVFLAGLVCVLGIFIQTVLLYRLVILPVRELTGGVEAAERDLAHASVPETAETRELYGLEKMINYLFREVVSGKMQIYEKRLQQQEMQLRQLRSQLRPHFYLNALTTVNSMTYQNRNEDIRRYLSALSDYIRYMLRIKSQAVSLGEELENIENYLKLQEIKFPGSVVGIIDCPEELKRNEIPFLILYTVVENSFKYALNLEDSLLLMIQCEPFETESFSGYRVVVEDNGKGFSAETLEEYNGERGDTQEQGYHIGLTNVKKTLELYYGRKDLFYLSNVVPHGARTEIRIPGDGRKI